jgi:hypothetical protein
VAVYSGGPKSVPCFEPLRRNWLKVLLGSLSNSELAVVDCETGWHTRGGAHFASWAYVLHTRTLASCCSSEVVDKLAQGGCFEAWPLANFKGNSCSPAYAGCEKTRAQRNAVTSIGNR